MPYQLDAATYAVARSRTDYVHGQPVFVNGRTATGDGGEGMFRFDSAGSTSINDGVDLTVANGGVLTRVFDGDINVRWFGAVGDSNGTSGNGTDSTEPFRKALAYAANASIAGGFGYFPVVPEGGANVFAPPGTYRVTGNLDDLTTYGVTQARRQGFKVHGARYKTWIFADTGDGVFLFDCFTGTPTRSYIALAFEDLSFIGGLTPSTASSFMQLWSDGQGGKWHTWTRCHFHNFKKVIRTEGSLNADILSFDACRFSGIWENLLHLNNNESVVHQFDNCEVGTCFADALFRIDGGGSISWESGSIVNGYPASQGGKDTPQWLIQLDGGSQGNNRNVFNNTRFERRGQYTRLVKATASAVTQTIFENCTWGGAQDVGTPREVVDLEGRNRVDFIRCGLIAGVSSKDDYRYKFTSVFDNQRLPMRPVVTFDGCELPTFNSAHYVMGGDAYGGRAVATDCYGQVIHNAASSTINNAMDFTYPSGTAGMGTDDCNIRTHKAALFRAGTAWPYNSASGFAEKVVRLPENAVITRIVILKPAQGSDGTTYQLQVGTNDKVTVYGSSTSGRQDAEHKIVLNDLLIDVGTATNTRDIRLWSSPVGSAAQHYTGFAFVEYI